MKVWIASDHAGFELKEEVCKILANIEWADLGTNSNDRCDYPDYAEVLCNEVAKSEERRGILICSSGQGMAIAANRNKKIRAALCTNLEMVELARAHNNANVLCLGAKWQTPKQAAEFIEKFLETAFEGGRHEARVAKLS